MNPSRSKLPKLPFAMMGEKLVHVSEVESGTHADCICPACKAILTARKGKVRVHHFAHSAESNCQPETVAHVLAKMILLKRITAAISAGVELNFQWQCHECHRYHQSNLVADVASVVVERELDDYRPDVTLLDKTGHAITLVEVVVTHAPELALREYCSAKKIRLVEFHIAEAKNLEALKLAACPEATRTSIPCLKPKCQSCGRPLSERKVFVGNVRCWKCRAMMRVGLVGLDGRSVPPSDMTDTELSIAVERGASIDTRYSRRGDPFKANVCPKCDAYWSDSYVDRYEYAMNQSPGIHVGWECPGCPKTFIHEAPALPPPDAADLVVDPAQVSPPSPSKEKHSAAQLFLDGFEG